MMGGQSSKSKGGVSPSSSVQSRTSSRYAEDLRSYEDACKLDPDLQNFDATLQGRTSHVITTLATGDEVRKLSLGSFKEVTNCLLEMNQDVVQVILESKEDILNTKGLSGLVEEYFKSSVKTMDFCNALEHCLKRARSSHLIMQVAIRQFEEEVAMQDGAAEKKFVKTLAELEKFKAAGDPFTKEFFELFQLVYKQQVSLLKKLQAEKRKLDKKLKSMRTWRRVSNVLFVSAFVAVLIFSVVAAAIAAPPVVTALAGALAVPIGSVGKWCNSLWNNYEKEVKGKKELVTSIWVGTFIQIKDMDSIRVLVNKLEMEIETVLQTAEIAIREEDAIRLVIEEIKKNMEVLLETIEDLGAHADRCSRDISRARTMILDKIMKFPDR
ncbi:hypothetical protein Tsubulata_045719 [Turnera subulata]|uniref:Uncharacterized protein n=1 Tax=Turnera subulata TaxID=218843 RepID=A0A9Q0FER1_9ROSI|nr:hypothetical protein Tsubulata_045719 [Turnera subulata]